MATVPKGKNARCSERTLYDNSGVPIHRSSAPTVSVEGVQQRLVWWKQADASKGEVHPCELPDGTHIVTGAGHEYRLGPRTQSVQQKSGFLQGIGAMRDQNSADIKASHSLCHGPVQVLPDRQSHVFTVYAGHILKFEQAQI